MDWMTTEFDSQKEQEFYFCNYWTQSDFLNPPSEYWGISRDKAVRAWNLKLTFS